MSTEEITTAENELEELVLRESIVSATGLNENSVQIGIKGDPSLRETSLDRKRYESPVDKVIEPLMDNLEELMLNRSCYRIFIGFNSGEIRTNSIFDPLRQEIHSSERLADQSYLDSIFHVSALKIKFRQCVISMVLLRKVSYLKRCQVTGKVFLISVTRPGIL